MTGHQPKLIQWFSENSHDTHLRAYTHIDLCELDRNGSTTGKSIIESLLKKNGLELTIDTSSESDRKLFQLSIDHKNTIANNGFHGLGLGFPIIKLNNKKTKKTCLAPLFIWNIQISNQDPNKTSWKISHKSNDTIRLNNALYRYIKDNYKIDLLKLSHSFLSNKNLNNISLSKICYELSSALGKKEDLFLENIKSISEKAEGNILCAGVISNFTESLVIPKSKSQKKIKAGANHHPFSTSILDPSQEKIFSKVFQQPITKVISEAGTGKSHLTHYTLINAISNGLRSLVIADSTERIKKIRNEFSANELDHLVLDITNPEQDLSKIVQALSNKSIVPKEDFDETYFNYLINLCNRNKDRLDTSFNVLDQAIFDKTTWPQIVGSYLKYNRQERQDLLDNQLNAKDFTFHPTEYLSLKEAVNISKPLYNNIKTLKHPLHNLHPDLFLEKTKLEVKEFISDRIKYFHNKFDELHHRYILKQQDYSKDLSNIRRLFYQEALLKIENLKDHIEDNRVLYGNEFEESGLIQTGRLKVYGVFSGKHKNILLARNHINEQFKDLRLFLGEEKSGHFEIMESVDSKPISKVSAHLNELEDQLYQWNNNLPDQLQEELQRLNTKSIHSSLDYGEQINELEYTLDINIEELNASGLYHIPKENKMLTIPMRQLFIQEIIDQLQNTQNYLADFEVFYEWQRHWLLLPEIHRKLLTAIIKVNPKNWKIAFQSWYFYQRLKMDFHFKMPKDETALEHFENNVQKLQALLPKQIRQAWKQQSVKRKTVKELSKLSFLELFQTQFELLSSQFPVIVMTHPVAALLFNHQDFDFELGIIFNNNQDHQSQDLSTLSIAKHTLAFTSALNKDQILNISNHSLNNIHKKILPASFKFSNRMIYQGQKNMISPMFQEKESFQVNNIGGQFRQNINTREAERIIEDLIKLYSESGSKNIRINIICSTIEQRDFITRQLIQRSNNGSSEAPILNTIISKSLGVFHLMEDYPNSVDHLFFSLGIHSFTHTSNELLSFLNSKSGFETLERLTSTKTSSLHIYHSISENDLDNYLSYKTKKSTRILASWIRYSSALANNDLIKQKAILESFEIDQEEQPKQLSKEIANELIPFIGKNRILQGSNILGVQLPLLILPLHEKGKNIAILSDGALDPQSIRSHLWNRSFIKKLNAQGISTISVWSANWFENPPLEARRLASAILKQDKEQI